MKLTGFLLIFLISCSYKGKIISCHDGDTVTMLTDNGKLMKIRLAECDANEIGQPGGEEAKQFTINHLLNHEVSAKQIATDKYHRPVCKIYISGSYFNKELVSAGWAVVYRKYASSDMYSASMEAKSKRLGIWSGTEIMPFVWRKTHK